MKESYSFSEEVVRTCSIKKLLIKFSQTSLWNLIKKETPIKIVSVNLVKFLKTPILQETCKWLVLDFAQFYMSHSIIHFINWNSIFWMYSAGFQYRRTIAKRKNWIRKCNFSLYFLPTSMTWNHSLGHGSRHEVNEWMKIFNLL